MPDEDEATGAEQKCCCKNATSVLWFCTKGSHMAKTLTPHEAALAALVPENEREDFELAVRMLVARNDLLNLMENQRRECRFTKQALADRASLDPASVRRLLTAETANPTLETTMRLLSVLSIKLEAVLPSGDRVSIVH